MGDVKWIKLSTGMFSESRKIKQIETMPEGDTVLVIWLKLMLLAGQINDGGAVYLTPEIPYTEEMLALELRRPLTVVKLALRIFEQFKMLRYEDGVLYLTSWEKYQNVDGMERLREQNRARQKRWYNKNREQSLDALPEKTKPNVRLTPDLTHPNAAEKEIEEDKEEEKERTDDIRSPAHSLFEGFEKEAPSPESTEEDEKKQRRRLGGSLGRGVVMLSDEQIDSLLLKLSAEEFDYYVSVIAENEFSGKHYKKRTHYQAILDMAAIDRKI